jgi:glycosyltransferase involved in cell wall biosynthesis
VLLIAPLPPPRGGIGTWAESVLALASRCDGIRIRAIDTSPRWRPVDEPRRWRRTLAAAGQACRDLGRVSAHAFRDRPDVIHLATSAGLALVRDACVLLLARLLRVRAVYHLHIGWLARTEERGGAERAGLWLTLRLCDTAIVLDSPSVAAARRINPAASVLLLPNFIDVAEWRASDGPAPAPPRRPRVLFVGWVLEAKGVRELVAACASLASRRDLELVLAGPADSGFLAELTALAGPSAAWLQTPGEVARGDLKPLMESADVLVLPSHYEGCPYVVLEAMSLGLAIVATRVGAIPEMLSGDGAPAGELVPPRDAAALERALDLVLADAGLRAALGRQARLAAERRFSIDAVRDRYVRLWTGSAAG